jgi:hypothetical protein
MKVFLIGVFLSIGLLTVAQNRNPIINNEFQFKDGIYLSIQELIQNQPSLLWEDIESNQFFNRRKLEARVGNLVIKSENKPIALENVVGFSYQGVPYIHIHELKPANQEDFGFFTALKLRGAIGYFSYTIEKLIPIEMNAYNPLTGIPFRKGKVDKMVEIQVKQILNFSTGAILDLNLENLMKWTSHDAEFTKYIRTVDEEKYFQSILLYNERHPFYAEPVQP